MLDRLLENHEIQEGTEIPPGIARVTAICNKGRNGPPGPRINRAVECYRREQDTEAHIGGWGEGVLTNSEQRLAAPGWAVFSWAFVVGHPQP